MVVRAASERIGTAELASRLGKSRGTIQRWVRDGDAPCEISEELESVADAVGFVMDVATSKGSAGEPIGFALAKHLVARMGNGTAT